MGVGEGVKGWREREGVKVKKRAQRLNTCSDN